MSKISNGKSLSGNITSSGGSGGGGSTDTTTLTNFGTSATSSVSLGTAGIFTLLKGQVSIGTAGPYTVTIGNVSNSVNIVGSLSVNGTAYSGGGGGSSFDPTTATNVATSTSITGDITVGTVTSNSTNINGAWVNINAGSTPCINVIGNEYGSTNYIKGDTYIDQGSGAYSRLIINSPNRLVADVGYCTGDASGINFSNCFNWVQIWVLPHPYK